MDKEKITQQSEFIQWAVKEKQQVTVFLNSKEIIRGAALNFEDGILIVKSDEETSREISKDEIHTFWTTSTKRRLTKRVD